MEARATINSASVSRTFLAAVLVLVAMGLAAMAGYAARGVFGENSGKVTSVSVGHPAAGTSLRQDNPVQAPAEMPGWMQREIAAPPARRIVIDQGYINQYLATPAADTRSTGHKELP